MVNREFQLIEDQDPTNPTTFSYGEFVQSDFAGEWSSILFSDNNTTGNNPNSRDQTVFVDADGTVTSILTKDLNGVPFEIGVAGNAGSLWLSETGNTTSFVSSSSLSNSEMSLTSRSQ